MSAGSPVLDARSPLTAVMAAAISLGATALAILCGLGTITWPNMVGVCALLGVSAGLAIAAAEMHVMVFPDRIVSVDLWRRVEIFREDISRVVLVDGIIVELVSGRRLRLGAFSGSIGAMMSGNRHGRRVGAKLMAALGVHEEDQRPGHSESHEKITRRMTSGYVILASSVVLVALSLTVRIVK